MSIKPLQVSQANFSKDISTADPRASLVDAISLMQKKNIRHLPIVDNGKIVGLLSDRDIRRAIHIEVEDLLSLKLVHDSIDPNLLTSDVMSWPVYVADKKCSLLDITNFFLEKKVSSILLSENDVVYGIVTTYDMLQLLQKKLLDDDLSFLEKLESKLIDTPIGGLMDALSQSGI